MRQYLHCVVNSFSMNKNRGLPTEKQIARKLPPGVDKTQLCVSSSCFLLLSMPIPWPSTSRRRAQLQPPPLPYAMPPQICFPYPLYSLPDSISFARNRLLARLYCDLEVPSLMFSMLAISLCPYPSIAKRLKTTLHPLGKDCTIRINSEKWNRARLISSVS